MHLNNHVTVRFLEVLQRNGCNLQLSMKVEGLSINFSNVATSSDVSPQIYGYRVSTISDVWWFDSIFLSLGCFPTRILDDQQNQSVSESVDSLSRDGADVQYM